MVTPSANQSRVDHAIITPLPKAAAIGQPRNPPTTMSNTDESLLSSIFRTIPFQTERAREREYSDHLRKAILEAVFLH